MVIGESNIGKTQLVMAHLSYYFRGDASKFITISTREEMKLINSAHQSIVLDDFEFNSLEIDEILRLLDRSYLYFELMF